MKYQRAQSFIWKQEVDINQSSKLTNNKHYYSLINVQLKLQQDDEKTSNKQMLEIVSIHPNQIQEMETIVNQELFQSNENFYKILLKLLEKNPINRDLKDILVIKSILVRQVDYFSNLELQISKQTLLKCAQLLQYVIVESNSYVYMQGNQKSFDNLFNCELFNSISYITLLQGDKSMYFYIVLQGHLQEKVQTVDEVSKQIKLTEINKLEPGKEFGALELITHQTRFTSIHSSSQSYLLCLDNDSFQKTLLNYNQHEVSKKVDLLQEFQVFQAYSKSNLTQFIQVFYQRQFQRNQYVYREGDEPNEIYLVLSGEFQIFTKVNIKNEQTDLPQDTSSPQNQSPNATLEYGPETFQVIEVKFIQSMIIDCCFQHLQSFHLLVAAKFSERKKLLQKNHDNVMFYVTLSQLLCSICQRWQKSIHNSFK